MRLFSETATVRAVRATHQGRELLSALAIPQHDGVVSSAGGHVSSFFFKTSLQTVSLSDAQVELTDSLAPGVRACEWRDTRLEVRKRPR